MKETNNYKFKKPEGTDVININDFNFNFDIIDDNLNKNIVSIENINKKTEEIITLSSNGKKLIANAIINKGIQANEKDTFDILAKKINSISSGKYNSGDLIEGINFDIELKKLLSIDINSDLDEKLNMIYIIDEDFYFFRNNNISKFNFSDTNNWKMLFLSDISRNTTVVNTYLDKHKKLFYVLLSNGDYMIVDTNGNTIEKYALADGPYKTIYYCDITDRVLVSTTKKIKCFNKNVLDWEYLIENTSDYIEVGYMNDRVWILDTYYDSITLLDNKGKPITVQTNQELRESQRLCCYNDTTIISDPNGIYKYDYHGHYLKERSIYDDLKKYINQIFVFENKIFLRLDNAKTFIYVFDFEFNIIGKINLGQVEIRNIFYCGKYLILTIENKMYFYEITGKCILN